MSRIRKFSEDGVNLVVDPASGAVHVVDDAAFRALDLFGEDGAPPEGSDIPGSVLDEIAALRAKGMLFAPDRFAGLRKPGGSRLKALCLNVAHACDMRCGYCFAGGGEYGRKALMPEETAKAAVDFLIAGSGGRSGLEIDFFGGEPTLNFGVVESAVRYARSREGGTGKRFRFTITTNGYSLDAAKIRFINEHMDNAVLSLDGRREVNDRFRWAARGGGSYDAVVPKFLELARTRGGKDYYVRGTYTRENLDFAEDVLHIADLGFANVSVEPVVCADGESYALTESDLPRIAEEYRRLARAVRERRESGRGFVFFHFIIDLTGGPCVHKRLSGCGAGYEYMAVSPDGSLWPCHQFDGAAGFRLGDVFSGVTEPGISDRFAANGIYDKPGCPDCWARFYCGGGCAANAWRVNGDISKNCLMSCETLRMRTESALWLKVAE
ncbi:MAG: thioether cross-link-forming SCIFF peptide maturase [Clostridiales bacterium]|jgi:uncharacterized protein|nr:thioether cross-link-forming SCIFF peptide maturase [Clostridiales bacterium]